MIVRGLAGGAFLAWAVNEAARSDRPLAWLGLLGFYLFVAFVINPKPDPRNVGWAGGLIDHPLRWSDDQNRMLFGLKVLLLPGRFAVAGVRDLLSFAWWPRDRTLPRP
jgi:hypothetical protein